MNPFENFYIDDRAWINLSEVVTLPKTPPCFLIMEIAASWFFGSVAAQQSSAHVIIIIIIMKIVDSIFNFNDCKASPRK